VEDRQIVDRCIRGESRSWDILVDRYGPTVYEAARFTLRRVLGAVQDDDVENVAQAVLLGLCDKGFHRLKLFQARSSFRTWVTSVTCRFALNYVRTEKRKGSLKHGPLDPSVAELPDGEAGLLPGAEEREKLHGALEKLPPRERLLLKLFYFDGLSYKAIADVMKIPVNSISPFMMRAKESLRKHVSSS
jgi:RNA polymerase sigma factor (sigma-70 family)